MRRDQCSFYLHVMCITLWRLCVFINSPSDKTFAFRLIATCIDSFWHRHSFHLHSDISKHSYTNSMFSSLFCHIRICHSHSTQLESELKAEERSGRHMPSLSTCHCGNCIMLPTQCTHRQTIWNLIDKWRAQTLRVDTVLYGCVYVIFSPMTLSSSLECVYEARRQYL